MKQNKDEPKTAVVKLTATNDKRNGILRTIGREKLSGESYYEPDSLPFFNFIHSELENLRRNENEKNSCAK